MKDSILNRLPFWVAFACLIFSACHDHDHPHDDHGGHNHAAETTAAKEDHEDEVELTNTQIQKIGLTIGGFEDKNLKSTLKVNGKLELPPQSKANVSAITAGKVTNIAVKPGQYVKKGTTLATILNPDLIGWQQEYLEVQGEMLFLDKEYERQKELVEKEIAPKKQFEKVVSDRAIAQAKLKGLSSRMNLFGIPLPTAGNAALQTQVTVSSPISGYVREIKVNTGIYVEPQQDLFEIVDNHHLHIDFLVFEKDLPYIENGQIITFNLQSQPKNVMQATVFSIGKAINETDRSISVHAEINDEKTQLVPGMYVKGRVILEDRKVPALPEEAITIDKGLHYIFVKAEVHGEAVHFQKIPVVKGVSDLGYTEVTPINPLSPTAEIVTDGAYFLMAQSKKGEQAGGGHSH